MIVNGSSLFQAAPIKNMLPFKEKGFCSSHGLAEAGYDIRLKQDVQFTTNFNGHARVPVAKVWDYGGWHQSEGTFALASALEEFDMPDNLVGVVHDKSTWARQGLSVFNTVIEPGWKGFLTLELVYHRPGETLHLPAGTGIAQVLFHRLENTAVYNGKYQNQEDKPVAAR